MFVLGDIVAMAGRALGVMVVDIDGPMITVAWRSGPRTVCERVVHASALIRLKAEPRRRA